MSAHFNPLETILTPWHPYCMSDHNSMKWNFWKP